MKALPDISGKLTTKEIEELESKYIAGIDPYEEGNCNAIIKDEIKQYVAYKGIHEKPKTTESGIGYFENEIGWYYKQGELKISDNIKEIPVENKMFYDICVEKLEKLIDSQRHKLFKK